jgi:hypothetical protein
MKQVKLCTFEVATHLGRHRRLGGFKDGRVVDLNFATAWYMAQTGEAEPQRLADALVPSGMLEFLRTGLRASHTAEELFLGAGPHPADWWRREPPPRGPNDETLVYRPGEVRICAPLPAEGTVGPDGDLPRESDSAMPCVAAIAGLNGVAGYTLMLACGRHAAMGPYLVTPDDIKGPLEVTVRVNGQEKARSVARLGLAALGGGKPRPGGMIPCGPDGWGPLPLATGDVVELEAVALGLLRTRAVQGLLGAA